MENVTAYPLVWPETWPRTEIPKRSRFGDWRNKPSIYNGMIILTNGLRLMGCESWNFIVSSNLRLKNDGLPYSSQKIPDDRGIAMYFKYKGDKIVIACDTYDLPGCNLWAISKTIEAMRGIERWGCSEFLKKAFMGFKALPETGTQTVLAPWWEVLGIAEVSPENIVRAAYRELVKTAHPDNGGSEEEFRKIKRAYDIAVDSFKI